MTAVLELAADQRSRQTGAATPLPQAEAEPEGNGAGVDAAGQGPPDPPTIGRVKLRERPERQPQWIRLLLYGAMLIACFLVCWAIGGIWARIDRAAWGEHGDW